ncbi:MAG TPA: hypothetical protein VIJ15_15225, partial [Dermatophilaceae bacterium]
SQPALDPGWNALRGPATSFATVGGEVNGLSLRFRPRTFADGGTPAFLGRRQQHRDVDVAALVDVEPVGPREWAGLAVRLSDEDYFLFVVAGAEAGVVDGTGMVDGTGVVDKSGVVDKTGVAVRDKQRSADKLPGGYRLVRLPTGLNGRDTARQEPREPRRWTAGDG